MDGSLEPGFLTQHRSFASGATTVHAAGRMHRGVNSTKSLTVILLVLMVTAFVVVADQLIDTWADGQLLAAWVALWAVGIASAFVFAGSARKLAAKVVGALDAWAQKVAAKRAEDRLWAIAQTDPRVMAELTAAMQRHGR